MRRDRHVAVIGGGQASARAVAAMRAAGYDGLVTLIGDEPELPYERPPLSKEALFGTGDIAPATIFDEGFFAEKEVEVALGRRVASVDAASGAVMFEDGAALKADRILLATGARARELALPDVAAERIFFLRNVADAKRLRPLLQRPCNVALIGGGFIGLEIAAGAAKAGCSVTIIECCPRLMMRAVSPRVSEYVKTLHEANGVTIKTNCAIVGSRTGAEATELLLSDDTRCAADIVIVGVGAMPNSELARDAGITCGNGIEVDADCRTSSGIVWAAGDVAARVHPFCGERLRLESWENAEIHGARAGRSIATSWSGGESVAPESDPPWFWTDQYAMNLQILGDTSGGDRIVARKQAKGEILFHLHGERLCGAELISAGRERTMVKRLLQSRCAVSADRLGDPDLPLKEQWQAAQHVALEKDVTLGVA